MDYGIFSSCSLCTQVDGVHNRHASKLFHELFPEVPISGNLILCPDCSSMLDMYRNIKVSLVEIERKFKQKESDELNIADIMWPNGETNSLNDGQKCDLCSKNMNHYEPKWVVDDIVLQVFPSLDATFCSSIKLCKKCNNTFKNLKSFKIRNIKMRSELLELNKDTSKDLKCDCILNSPSESSYKSDDTMDSLSSTFMDLRKWWDSKSQKFVDYKVFLVEAGKKELKPMKRNGVYLYTCPKCEVAITDLRKHFEKHKELSSKLLYSCEICNFQNGSLDKMQTHQCKEQIGESSEEAIFECPICPFKSKQKGNLKTHSLVHQSTTEIKMYKCGQCKFQSRQKGNLKTHKLTHQPKDKIKMHKCSQCSYAARQKGNLQTHMLKKHENISEANLYEYSRTKCKIFFFKTKEKNIFKKHMEDHSL